MKHCYDRAQLFLLFLWPFLFRLSGAFVAQTHRSHLELISRARLAMRAKMSLDGEPDRRNFLGGLTAAAIVYLTNSNSADARGLIMFPCTKPLGNTYHFIRGGESLLEVEDVWSTNPLFLTNREAALSDRGIEEVERSCRQLRAESVIPTLVRYSLAASATDTANIVGKELNIGRDRLVPEFNFMDPRSVGKWDMLPLSATQAAVWAMDNDEAGPQGVGARPPANEDGTPHETLSDQVVRLRQLISVLETQFSGETILLVFPDGTGPALLSAMIAGIPLNRAHELEFQPGEVRLNVTMASTLALATSKSTEEYAAALERGRDELRRLRAIPSDAVVSVQDQQLQREQIELDREVLKRQDERNAREESTRATQRERTQQVESERQRRRDEISQARKQEVLQIRASSADANKESATSSPVKTVVGSVGALLLGALAVANRSNSGDEETVEQRLKAKAAQEAATATKSSASTNGESSTGSDQSLIESARDVPPDSQLEKNEVLGDLRSAGEIESSLNGESSVFDAPTDTPITGMQSPTQATQQPYDDGGDSWLQSLADIIEEDDDNDLDMDNQ